MSYRFRFTKRELEAYHGQWQECTRVIVKSSTGQHYAFRSKTNFRLSGIHADRVKRAKTRELKCKISYDTTFQKQ